MAAEMYHALPSTGDIDLVTVVRELLVKEGFGDRLPVSYDNDQHIIDGTNRKPEVQRHLLNLYFNLQLMCSPVDSSTVRYCLLPDGDIQTWISYFRSFVLPFLKEHDLLTMAVRPRV